MFVFVFVFSICRDIPLVVVDGVILWLDRNDEKIGQSNASNPGGLVGLSGQPFLHFCQLESIKWDVVVMTTNLAIMPSHNMGS